MDRGPSALALRCVPLALVALGSPAAAQQLLGELRRMVPTANPSGLVHDTGDVDGDGDVDVYMPGYVVPDTVLLNNGSGRLSAAAGLVPPGVTFARSAHLFDPDADGDQDAFLGGIDDFLYENDGAGHFSDASAAWLAAQPLLAATIGADSADLDGDGDVDVCVASDATNVPNRVLRNDGGSYFYKNLAQPIATTREVALADVDQDGDLDLIAQNQSPPHFLYRNDGAMVFTATFSALPPTHAGLATELEVGDVDADGDPDLVLATSGPNPDVLWLKTASGFVDASSQLPTAPLDTTAAGLGDLDGDGDLDLWLGNEGEPFVLPGPNDLWLNAGSGSFVNASDQLPAILGVTFSCRLVDLDGDADLDVFVESSEYLRLELNDGAAHFTEVSDSSLPLTANMARGADWGDVDGDGDQDLLVGRADQSAPLQSRLYLNGGVGRLLDATETHMPSLAQVTFGVALHDLDGDGDPDGALANWNQAPALLWNDGSGVFTHDGAALGGAPLKARAVVATDLFGDGDVDLVFGTDDQNPVFEGTGGGGFAPVSVIPASTLDTYDLAAGDVDGDGDPDLFEGNLSFALPGAQNRLLINNGAAFAVAATFAPAPDKTRGVAFLDAELDGDLDLVWGNEQQTNRFWRNTGSGFADHSFVLPGDADSTQDVAVLDVNGDGFPDLYFAHSTLQQADLLLNDGAGTGFIPSPAHLSVPTDARCLSVADADGNGREDVFMGGWNASHLEFNLSHQLAWGTCPRVGKDLTLELHGQPLAPWYLFFSLGQGFFPVGTLGTLKLNPFVAGGLLTAGSYPASGAASVTGSIPNEPALIGQSLYWQDLGGFAPVFGNLEVTTFTGL